MATLAATAGALAMPSLAAPRHRHHHLHHAPRYAAAPPVEESGTVLTVHKRSFLDAGVVVPVGTESRYVTESTILGAPYVIKDLLHQRYDAGLPNRFELPGSSEPLFVFETPRVD